MNKKESDSNRAKEWFAGGAGAGASLSRWILAEEISGCDRSYVPGFLMDAESLETNSKNPKT